MGKQKKAAVGRKEWPKQPTQPVVFMFQPTEYEPVPQDKLSEWETLLRERVGLPERVVEALRQGSAQGLAQGRMSIETFSRTGGDYFGGLDDCDAI